ncbi:MAG: hypothetical protein M3071_03125 [Actinomycetota bacterium]|nr:hypothetical protein [Actinomycetota bacterium]
MIVDHAELPVYMRIREKARHLRELGMSDKAIARALDVSDKDCCESEGINPFSALIRGGGPCPVLKPSMKLRLLSPDQLGKRLLVCRGEIESDPWRFPRRIEDEHDAIKERFAPFVRKKALTEPMDDHVAAINEHSHIVSICGTVGGSAKYPDRREVELSLL